MLESRVSRRLDFLGVAREKRFSPGVHAAGDAEILNLTRVALEGAGYRVAVIEPEDVPLDPPDVGVIFSMSQSRDTLQKLQHWEQQGIVVLNRPAAVLSCYRLALVRMMQKSKLPFPPSVVLALSQPLSPARFLRQLPASDLGWWVKRGDVHAMQADDVCFARQGEDAYDHVVRLQQRGLQDALVQAHVEGVEIKFYAVRNRGLIHHFTPRRDIDVPITSSGLQALVQAAGACFDLDIFGGDCLLTPEGDWCLIDINDWPSFRGCRPRAAQVIAWHLITCGRKSGRL